MKKAVIIGAGIAGLSCGIYAQLNGFDTEIYEMHTIPGGECTGWDRGGYHFDGCIHWLAGSGEGTGLNGLWRDTGALSDDVEIMNHEIFSHYEEDGREVNLYTDADRLKTHLMEIAPEDKKPIRRLCGAIKALGPMEMPVAKPMDMMSAGDGIKYMLANLGMFRKVIKYSKISVSDLAAGFTSPLLRRALLASMSGGYTAMALVSTLAGMNAGDCGYPMGGSRALARRMEARYTGLGGRINYKSPVDKIIVEDGMAVGVRLTGGSEIPGDYLVSCADGYATLYHMLADRYTPEPYRNLFSDPKRYPTITCALVFAGVDAKLSGHRSVTVRRREPVELNGIRNETVNLLNYGYDPMTAPEGKTVLACFYDADYDYWKALHADRERYAAEKRRLRDDAVAAMIERYPEAEGRIEVTDVVTPVTYEKYCNAWRGAWMTWAFADKAVPRYFPGVLPGLSNFIMAGIWTSPPGGLPGAGAAGRFAAHRLCAWEGREFRTGRS